MHTNQKVLLQRTQQRLRSNMISNISTCLQEAVKHNAIGSLKSKLTTAVTRSIKKYESSTEALNMVGIDIETESALLAFEHRTDHNVHGSSPEIEALKRSSARLRMELTTKENELRNWNRRASLTKDLTRNDAIVGLVANVIKKFKTLSSEKQNILINDKALLARNVEKYIKDTVVFYDTQEKAWGIAFKKNDDILEELSTGKDVVVLAMNLSSKYVHLATSSIYNAARVQHALCRKERDELKDELAKVDTLLQIAYAKEGNSPGFKGGFGGFGGGGRFGGGGASGDWNYQL